ncbi:MAG: sugar-phosphate isomerase [Segetibacter sp.]|nr:sugar-phosphate isomerase [Segetibacter sp.]
MKIGVAADHAGFDQKQGLINQLRQTGHLVNDYGAFEFNANDDYPDIIVPLAKAVSAGEVDRGIAVCGSGVGVSIAANKFVGVRAALITESYSAHQGVEHDAMNLICLGGRVIGPMLIWEIIQAFLKAEYKGEERFQRRLNKLIALEKKSMPRYDLGV